MLSIFAVLAYVVGGLGIIASIFLIANAFSASGFDSATKALSFSLIASSLGALASGAILMLLAEVSLAIRDIARNSFGK